MCYSIKTEDVIVIIYESISLIRISVDTKYSMAIMVCIVSKVKRRAM